jgi:hypothetical protein
MSIVEGLGFDHAIYWLTLPLFIATIVMIFWIGHEVWPFLNEDDRIRIQEWFRSGGHGRINAAIRRAWSEHYRAFPRSRKRALFACLLIATSLSVFAYPLWLVLGKH